MRTSHSTLWCLLVILYGPLGFIAAQESGEKPIPQSLDDIRQAHDERPADAPAIVNRREQRRSKAPNPTLGPFVSVQVNVDSIGNNIVGDAANEPSITLNPTDPQNMVVGWRQFDTITNNFRQAGMAFSNDGGLSWNNNGPLDPGVFRSDPVMDVDSSGTVFYYSLTTNDNFSEFFCDMFISDDGGSTWSAPIPAGGGDKQWFVVDKSGGSGDGFVHALWSPFFSCCPSGFFTRSTDGGLNYLLPINIPEDIYWGTLSVGPGGELYVCGRDIFGDMYVIRSNNADNGGQTPSFPQVRVVNLNGTIANGSGPNPGGLLGQFDIETDHSGGQNHGNVYALCSVNPPGSDPLDVMFSRSTDGGFTWSSPTRINSDPSGSGRYNWFGTMSVSPDGRIDVIWNDMRDDPGGVFSAMYYSASKDGGLTWSDNVQVTPEFNSLLGHPNQNKIGDYYDMRSTNDAVHVIYSATFNGEQDVYYLRINIESEVAAQTLDVLVGEQLSGGVAEIANSDNQFLLVRSNELGDCSIEITGDAGTPEPCDLSFVLESSQLTLARGFYTQDIELFNFDSQSYELLATVAIQATESSTTVSATGDLSRFVGPSNELRARVTAEQGIVTFNSMWSWIVDQAAWKVSAIPE